MGRSAISHMVGTSFRTSFGYGFPLRLPPGSLERGFGLPDWRKAVLLEQRVNNVDDFGFLGNVLESVD